MSPVLPATRSSSSTLHSSERSLLTQLYELVSNGDTAQLTRKVNDVKNAKEKCPSANEIHALIIRAMTTGKSLSLLKELTRLPKFDIDAVSDDAPFKNKTLLAIAAELKDTPLCQHLLQQRANPDQIDSNSEIRSHIGELLQAARVINNIALKPRGKTSNTLQAALDSYDIPGIYSKLEHEVEKHEGKKLGFSSRNVQRYLEIASDKNRPDMTCAILALAKPEWITEAPPADHAGLCAALKQSQNKEEIITASVSVATPRPPDSKRGLSLVERNWAQQLDDAVKKGMADILDKLLPQNAIPPDRLQQYMQTALEQAFAKEQNSLPVVKILLDKGAKAPDGTTLLHLAASNSNLEVTRFLLKEQGIDPNTPDKDGEAALFIAVKNGHAAMAALLLEHGALQFSQAAAARIPADKKPLLALISVQRKQKDFNGALQSVDKLIAAHPATSHIRLKADVLIEANRASDAEAMLLQHRPIDSNIMWKWFDRLMDQGRHDEMVDRLSEMVAEMPDTAILFHFRGMAYDDSERHELALEDHSRAYQLDPSNKYNINRLAMVSETLGNLSEAKKWLETGLQLDPRNAFALYHLGRRHRYVAGDEAFRRLTTAAEKMGEYSYSDWDQLFLHYALGKAYDDTGDLALAFDHYRMGNEFRRKVASNAPTYFKAYESSLKELKARLRPETIARGISEGHPSSKPIFIVSMPRSGSTLLDQMLASHQKISSVGEFPFLDFLNGLEVDDVTPIKLKTKENTQLSLYERGAKYLTKIETNVSGSPERIVNKMPLVALHAGLIPLILPNANIINCRRHPVEICLSCYRLKFDNDVHGFTNDLAELGQAYRTYHEMMQFWKSVLPEGKILEVWYEDVVDDTEAQMRRVLDHVGMPWDENCLRFNETKRPVRTLSVLQVRQPIYRDAIDNRWHKYKPYLGPLLEALGPLVEEYERELVEGRENRRRMLQHSSSGAVK